MRNLLKGCFAGILILTSLAPQTVHSQFRTNATLKPPSSFNLDKVLMYSKQIGGISDSQARWNSELLLIKQNQNRVYQQFVADQEAAAEAVAIKQRQAEQMAYVAQYSPSIIANHQALMAEAGISPNNYPYVEYIVDKESGWDACAYYPSQHNCNGNPVAQGVACGLVMQNPCGKIAGDWRNPINALIWANSYVQRYGGWYGAYQFWLIHHSY